MFKNTLVTLLGASLLVAVTAAAGAEFPAFPFKTTDEANAASSQQGLGACATGPTYNIVTVKDGNEYIVFHGTLGNFAAAYTVAGIPEYVYFGYVLAGDYVVVHSEPFDPAKHVGPCEDWLDNSPGLKT